LSKGFKITLIVRSIGYTIFFCGLLALILAFGPVAKVELGYRLDKALGVKRTVAEVAQPTVDPNASPGTIPASSVSFGDIDSSGDVMTPVSTDFGLVIPKINANALVIPNVSPGNENEYVKILQKGVAHAAGTNFPGEVGNVYLFSHSTDAPWNVVRYNAIFYLLRELEEGDQVVIFYQGRRYNYIVFDKIVVEPDDVSYLTNKYDKSVLTMQTCDPPGTLLKRLIVRARLAGS
jgi:sortase A